MIPRHIANATHALRAPKDWSEAEHGKCTQLWIRRDGGDVFASAWEPTPAELEALNAGASVILSIVGSQPPVALHVEVTEEISDA